MDVNAAVAAVAAVVGLGTGVVAMLAFRISERERTRPLRTTQATDQGLPAGVDTVLSVLRSSAVVLDQGDGVVKASSAAYALGLVRGGRLAVEPMLRMARETRRDGEIRQRELDLPPRGHSRGDVLAVSARSAPLGSRLVLLLVEDLTEARRIEAVRRDFVANVSHELKTPAGALSLLSETVMDASDDPQAVRHFAGRMQTEATRLTNLVQELIDLSRVQDNDPLTNAEVVGVDDLVTEAMERCRQQAAAKHITMAPGGSAGLDVWGNRGQLAAALGNLVENAVTYSPPDTRVAIAVARRLGGENGASGGRVEIAVTDQGIGISETDRERIFERFYRVDPARSRATGGTGLGLAIVKHVVASHGGEIQVWSAEGQGSTFTLTLPEPGGARGGRRTTAGEDRADGLSGALRRPGDVPESPGPGHRPESPGPGHRPESPGAGGASPTPRATAPDADGPHRAAPGDDGPPGTARAPGPAAPAGTPGRAGPETGYPSPGAARPGHPSRPDAQAAPPPAHPTDPTADRDRHHGPDGPASPERPGRSGRPHAATQPSRAPGDSASTPTPRPIRTHDPAREALP